MCGSPQVKQSHRPVGTNGGEEVAASTREGDVVHLLVVSDELRLHTATHLADNLTSLGGGGGGEGGRCSAVVLPVATCISTYLQPPDSASGINARRPKDIGVRLVPVKRRQRSTEL